MKHPVLLHIKEHTWLWVAGLAACGVLAAVLGQSTPAALLFMVVGLLIIVRSQGTDLLTIVTDDPLTPEEDEPNLRLGPARH
ncbi:hypothetical protein E2C06_34050 [Dankookia rubra]|uniref:Uncharacterized protein n=1 Tax=Dankookia rubra TaxID=1442381 RepID=A0A4R5Q6N0_9PROT|nr:hypothetical protein [Dankookia rubra]TDH58159.1 hypothetical protein E2C06_34050 [Dankookia rubra]